LKNAIFNVTVNHPPALLSHYLGSPLEVIIAFYSCIADSRLDSYIAFHSDCVDVTVLNGVVALLTVDRHLECRLSLQREHCLQEASDGFNWCIASKVCASQAKTDKLWSSISPVDRHLECRLSPQSAY
jgi:hypothetical protein